MKLSADSFLKLCKNPLESWKSLLFYGNSEFWIQSKIDYFFKNSDPLKNHRSRLISQELILENKSLLIDMFFTRDFFAGPEVIILTQATDRIASFIEDTLNFKSIPFFIIQAQGYLKPTSKLRKLYEEHPELASIPCYELSASELTQQISSFFMKHHKKISPDLSRHLGNFFHPSPDTLKSELEKILMYVGPKETIEVRDLKNLGLSSGATDTLDLVNAFLDQDKNRVMDYIETLEDISSCISILRTLELSLARLHHLKCQINSGNSFEKSIKTLTPPLLFNEQASFKKRLSLWSQQQLENCLKKTSETEIFIKLHSKSSKEILEFFLLKTLILV